MTRAAGAVVPAQINGKDGVIMATIIEDIQTDIINEIGAALRPFPDPPQQLPARLRHMKKFHGSPVLDRMADGHFITRDAKEWINNGKPGFTVWQFIERTGDVIRHCPPAHFRKIADARRYVQQLKRRNDFVNGNDSSYIYRNTKFMR